MQKKIIALAIAAAFSAPVFADTANVNVYGNVNVSVESVNKGDAASGGGAVSATKVSSNISNLGVKGSEDLGDGVSAFFQIESAISADGGAGTTLGTYNTFAGLENKSMGKVLLGRHDTPYKLATRGLDVFANTIADNRSLMGGGLATGVGAGGTAFAGAGTNAAASFDGRQGDVIAYISPTVAGIHGAIGYVAGAETATAATVNKGSAMSAVLIYSLNDLFASVAYEVHNLGDAASGALAVPATATGLAGKKETAMKLGVGYKMGDLTLNVAYEKTADDFDTANGNANLLGHTAMFVAAKYNISSANAVKVAYVKAGDNATSSTGATQMSLGFDHSMSKLTSVYALYTALSNDTNGTYDLSNAGTTGGVTTAVGGKNSAIALGLKRAF